MSDPSPPDRRPPFPLPKRMVAGKPPGWSDRLRLRHRAQRYARRTEPWGIASVKKYLRPGDFAIDVGANKGAYTYWMARQVGAEGRVLAVEPRPEYATYIRWWARGEAFTQVELAEVALSDTDGVGVLHVPDANPRGGASLEAEVGREASSSLEVECLTLDELMARSAGGAALKFLKCDVEGHEAQVFGGGLRTLERDRPVLLFECQDYREGGGHARGVFEMLLGIGYRSYGFHGTEEVPVQLDDLAEHQAGHDSERRDSSRFDFVFR